MIPDQSWRVDDPVFLTLPEATGGDGRLTYELRPAQVASQTADRSSDAAFDLTLPDGLDSDPAVRLVEGTPRRRN